MSTVCPARGESVVSTPQEGFRLRVFDPAHIGGGWTIGGEVRVER